MTGYVCLIVPFPPTVNNLFVNNPRTRGRFSSKAYTAWKAEAARAFALQAPLPHFDGPVVLILSLGIPDKRRRDLSNYIKAVEDSVVAAGILNDDSQVVDLNVRWDEQVVGCRIEIVSNKWSDLLFGRTAVDAARSVA